MNCYWTATKRAGKSRSCLARCDARLAALRLPLSAYRCDRFFKIVRQRSSGRVRRAIRNFLRHNREREIVAVAAFVAGLEIVAVYRHDPAIRQIAERAADGISARVIDQSQS